MTEEGRTLEKVTWVGYGSEGVDTLRAIVRDAKVEDPMARVTVLVPNNIAGIVARRRLAEGLTQGQPGVAAVRLLTLRHVAEELAGPGLAASGRRPATSALIAAAVRASLSAEPGSFAAVADHPATARALVRAYRSLRDVEDSVVTAMSGASTLTSDVVRLCRSTHHRLADRFYDTTDLLVAAAGVLRDGTGTTDAFGTVVVYLPQDLDRAENDLLQAVVASSETVHLVAAVTGVTRADIAVHGLVPDRVPGTRHEPLATRVLTASDSDDEVRCVVREVVDALRTTPAHRLAVLYSSAAPYARLLHEHLSAAGVTVNGAGVRPDRKSVV